MRALIVVLGMLLSTVSAWAQVSIGIAMPGLSIGINLPVYPELVLVPGYPVYYAPRLSANFFFYDGMYWVYQDDSWYASSWYNGPWGLVAPEVVPLFVLRIPVRYYRNPPSYFRGWRPQEPPHWGEHWGNGWEQKRRGWDRWDHKSVPRPAPLPVYQRRYSADRYPPPTQQPVLRTRNYSYQPREPVVKQHYQEQAVQAPPAQRGRPGSPVQAGPAGHPGQGAREAPPQRQPAPPEQDQRRRPNQAVPAPAQQAPNSAAKNGPQGRGAAREPAQDDEKSRGKSEERGGGQNDDKRGPR